MPLHKKIIISANSAWNVVNFRKGIVLELINHGFEVVVVSPKDEYVDKLCDLGCQHININVDNKGINPINDLYLTFQYLKIFYQVDPNVILTYTVKPNIYGSLAAYILSIPIVNNISGLGTAFIRGGLLGRIVNFLYKISLRKSECVFFQNHDDENLFLKKNLVTKGQVSVLPGSGVNLEYYQPTKSNIVNKDQDEFVFLLIARLIWDKGIQEYVDAARFVKKYNPKARFQILGFLDVDNQTAVSHSEIDLWVAEGIVEYIGVTEDVRPHINSSDCVVLPSYREGVPKTLLEAAAMGKSIITTEVEGCKDVVDDGVNGYLCNVRDYNDLAEKMQTMLTMNSKDIEQMGLNGRKKMEQEFDEKIVINKYISIVNKIINGQ
jgi:glycosyltransferase involved in cell wall biosynthesis